MKKKILSLILLTVMILGLTGCGKDVLSDEEGASWGTLQLVAAESAASGQKTTITTKNMNDLKNVAKRTGKNWFSSLGSYAYVKNMDTDEYDATQICDGNYCATFKIKYQSDGYHLVDYTFEASDEKGYRISITEE